jgi:hypothetical protein
MQLYSRYAGNIAKCYDDYREQGYGRETATRYAAKAARSMPVTKTDKTLGTHVMHWAMCVLGVAVGVFGAVFGVVSVVQAWESMYWEHALVITVAVISVIAGSILFATVKDDM